MRDLLPPEMMCSSIDNGLPCIWNAGDHARAAGYSAHADWDKDVFMPMSGWGQIFSEAGEKEKLRTDGGNFMEHSSILGAWHSVEAVARFDQDLYNLLVDTPLNNGKMAEILWSLPACSIHVETPCLEVMAGLSDGFAAPLDQKMEGDSSLMFMCSGNESLVEFLSQGNWAHGNPLILDDSGVAKKYAEDFGLQEPCKHGASYTTLKTAIFFSLCTGANGFLDARSIVSNASTDISTKRTKNVWRIFNSEPSPFQNAENEFGNNVKNVRQALHIASGDRKSPGRHLRCAHWHGVWSGMKNERKKSKFGSFCCHQSRLSWARLSCHYGNIAKRWNFRAINTWDNCRSFLIRKAAIDA